VSGWKIGRLAGGFSVFNPFTERFGDGFGLFRGDHEDEPVFAFRATPVESPGLGTLIPFEMAVGHGPATCCSSYRDRIIHRGGSKGRAVRGRMETRKPKPVFDPEAHDPKGNPNES